PFELRPFGDQLRSPLAALRLARLALGAHLLRAGAQLGQLGAGREVQLLAPQLERLAFQLLPLLLEGGLPLLELALARASRRGGRGGSRGRSRGGACRGRG